MRLADPQAQIPGLRAAREREHLNRALAFAGVSWTLLGCDCVQLTPRHRLELQLGGNAFAIGMKPLLGDVFQLLWRLNPAFRVRPITLRSFMAHWCLKRSVKRMHAEKASGAIHAYLAAMLQDLPETSSDSHTGAGQPEKYLHWMSVESFFFIKQAGLTFAEYLDTPYLVLQQWHRASRLSAWLSSPVPNQEPPSFINDSDAIALRWFRGQQKSKGARDAN